MQLINNKGLDFKGLAKLSDEKLTALLNKQAKTAGVNKKDLGKMLKELHKAPEVNSLAGPLQAKNAMIMLILLLAMVACRSQEASSSSGKLDPELEYKIKKDDQERTRIQAEILRSENPPMKCLELLADKDEREVKDFDLITSFTLRLGDMSRKVGYEADELKKLRANPERIKDKRKRAFDLEVAQALIHYMAGDELLVTMMEIARRGPSAGDAAKRLLAEYRKSQDPPKGN